MTAVSRWTDQEVEQLRDLWDLGFPATEIAEKLGTTRNAVLGKLHRLGISDDDRVIQRKRRTYSTSWTDAENRLLTSLYEGSISISEISEELGRSESACYTQARKLNLNRPTRVACQ